MSIEHVDITTCPRCKQQHRYRLNVERSYVLSFFVGNISQQSRPERFTRLFTCPVKNEEFQASFSLNRSGDVIRDVQVVGVANDKDED
jgi:uncharacterized UBP type Zn finger protein